METKQSQKSSLRWLGHDYQKCRLMQEVGDPLPAATAYRINPMNDPAATIRRDAIKTDQDQPNRPLFTLSYFRHTSAFRSCRWFLAKNKNADAKRGFRDRRQHIIF